MPTYQYACTECGHAFEQFQSFTDDALTECPECGGKLRKVFNAVGVVFKGSGFYRTDSRTSSSGGVPGSSSSASGADSGGSGDSGSASGASKTEPSSATKTDAKKSDSGGGSSSSSAS